MHKTTAKRLGWIALWLVSVVGAFASGAVFVSRYLVFGPTIRSEGIELLVCPPPPEPLFAVEDFERANQAVKEFLDAELTKPEYRRLRPFMAALPKSDGYTRVYGSGDPLSSIPPEMQRAAERVLDDALWEKRRTGR